MFFRDFRAFSPDSRLSRFSVEFRRLSQGILCHVYPVSLAPAVEDQAAGESSKHEQKSEVNRGAFSNGPGGDPRFAPFL